MRILHLVGVAAVMATMAASPAMANGLPCENFVTATPNTAAVNRLKIVGSGGSLNGTAYTKAAFCPTAAAAGTCTGESLSERVGSTAIPYITYDGDVPDIYNHKDYFVFLGVKIYGPLQPGACS